MLNKKIYLLFIFYSQLAFSEEIKTKYCFDLNKINDGYYKVCLYKGEEEGSDNEARFSFFDEKGLETKYPNPAMYQNTKLIKVKNNRVYVQSIFSDNGLVDLNFIFSVKNKKVFLDQFSAYSYINVAPKGAKESCIVKINQIYNNPISYYVDRYLFDLNKKERAKLCVIKYNK